MCAACAAAVVVGAAPDAGATIRLPPLDPDPKRCERAFDGNTIGQANAVSDKLLDLRQCNFEKATLAGKTLSGALFSESTFSKANLQETVLTKAYAVGAIFEGADFSNAVVDRVAFEGANLKGAIFENAVITGTTWTDADLTGASFEDALIAAQDAKELCRNPTLVGDT